MQVQWFGQSAFALEAEGKRVFVDPFGAVPPGGGRAGLRFAYPPITGQRADLLLITHEHFDHNAAEIIGGTPHTIRSTAGTFANTPVGAVVAVASEHDPVAGTQRGPNTIFVFSMGGLRVCHFGDFGQLALRPEQAAAIGRVDLLLVPVGGGPTIGAGAAAAIVHQLQPRWVVPMHYRTEAISFLDPPDAFLAAFPDVRRLRGSLLATEELAAGAGPLVVVPAAPLRP